MVRIAIEVQAETARLAQGELEETLRSHGFVREEAASQVLLKELLRALRAAGHDPGAILDQSRAAQWADRLNREAA